MQQHHRIISILVFSIYCALSNSAEAQITVDRSIFYWKHASPPVQNLSVRNTSELPMLVEVKTEEVLSPGLPEEQRELANDILVAPKRFSVPPKGERVVRLLRKGTHGETERVFRVSFIPIARESTDDEIGQKIEIKGPVQTTLRVLSGVGILIFTQPKDAGANLSAEREGDTVRLSNTGNMNILVTKIRKCTPSSDDCEAVPPKRLYPGTSLVIAGASGKVVTFTKRIGNEFSEATVE